MARGIIEGIQAQGQDEAITYAVTVDPAPTGGLDVSAYDIDADYAEVTGTVFPAGSASYSGSVITLPQLTALTRGKVYRIEVQYAVGSDVVETFFEIEAER